ncbi:MAG: hypothetical protein FWF08_04180 [Oscillospiraceae bacterium]|nr:hypothetical protein [Oscillospiraceae bacterium]
MSIFRIRAAEGLQYRLAALSGATVSIFWVLIEVVVLTVFFKYSDSMGGNINGMTLAQGISYRWVGELMIMLPAQAVDSDLLKKITSGDIGIELCRPLDLYWHWFSRTAAGKVNSFVMRGSIVFAFGAMLSLLGFRSVGAGLPCSPLHFVLFIISLFWAFLFSTAYGMFATSIRIGLEWGDGPINLITVTGMVLSGSFLPLQLWPDFMQKFLRLQPFASYMDTPARLYVGSTDIRPGLFFMAVQLAWIAAFVVFGRMIMKRKVKNVIVQGG